MELYDNEWAHKGATLSDKTARAEFGLTQDEIIAAIRAGKLQYRPAEIHGNPWLRLLRREVEDLVSSRHGERYHLERQARAELKRVNRTPLFIFISFYYFFLSRICQLEASRTRFRRGARGSTVRGPASGRFLLPALPVLAGL